MALSANFRRRSPPSTLAFDFRISICLANSSSVTNFFADLPWERVDVDGLPVVDGPAVGPDDGPAVGSSLGGVFSGLCSEVKKSAATGRCK